MAKPELPSPELLRQLIDYDPETGFLYWKPRTAETFPSYQRDTWNRRFAGQRADKRQGGKLSRYRRVKYKKTSLLIAHRVCWAIFYGEWPEDCLDHVNGDGEDNRIANLRAVSRAENNRNHPMPRTNRSGVMGVSFDSRRWVATVRLNGRTVRLGRFDTFDDAVAARKAAESKAGYHPNHGLPGRPTALEFARNR